MFTNQDIADYYDQTEVHYRRFWKLEKQHAIHYGIWEKETKNFIQALENTNRILASNSNITSSSKVLDAGCGIGGSAIYLARKQGCHVTGISLSRKQIERAKQITDENFLGHLLNFEVNDYTDTGYPSNHFDVIWALESVGATQNTENFLMEANRLLKPGGVLVMADYFKTNDRPAMDQPLLQSWLKLWAISDLETVSSFHTLLDKTGFRKQLSQDYTKEILPTAKRMYISSILGSISSILYNIFHKKVSRFAKQHYKSGFLQYKALRKGLWKYKLIMARKP